MGQHTTNTVSLLPSRPKFHWDVKSPPWTDARGDQLEYKNQVDLWKHFHDSLPNNNSNKIPSNLQAICLKSQLFGRAIDLCSGITNTELSSEDGVSKIVNAIYQRDGLSVVSEAYRVFNDLLDTKRGNNESMKGFELRFAASVAKFNAISESTKLAECLTALMLISNAHISDSQRVSVLAAAASASEVENVATATNEEFLKSISYSSVSSVVKHCEGKRNGEELSLRGNLGSATNGRQKGKFQQGFRKGGRMTRDQYEQKTMKSPCAICGKYGHWKNEHLPDGSLPQGVKSVDKINQNNKTENEQKHENTNSNRKTVSFSNANLVSSTIEEQNELETIFYGVPNFEHKWNQLQCDHITIYQKPEIDVQCVCEDAKDDHKCQFCNDWSLPDHDDNMTNVLGKIPIHTNDRICQDKLAANNMNLVGYVADININGEGIVSGPLLDDGAPYSAIGIVELKLLFKELGKTFPKRLQKVPEALNGYSHFQYGTGSHASQTRAILGSIVLTAYSDSNRKVDITHIVISGSSQWIIGRNVTKYSNIEHINKNALVFKTEDQLDYISLVEHKFLTYIPIERFYREKQVIGGLSAVTVSNRPWKEIQKIVDKVHRHVCGHASYSDFKMLFERNNMWNESVKHYIENIMNECTACRKSYIPPPSRKVSISSLSKELNEIICVDHFYLDELCLIHFMDIASRFSTVSIASDKSMITAITAFEQNWITHFWYPNIIRGDKAFMEGEFKKYMDSRDIKFDLVPPGRHSRNAIESKHRAIRSIYLRLKEDKSLSIEACAVKAVSISNDLYGSSIMSSFELAKGYSKPIGDHPVQISDDIVKAYEDIQARRKLARIIKSKGNVEKEFTVGDMIEIFVHGKNNKRGEWSNAKKIIKIDKEGRAVYVPGMNGKTVIAAFEDVRLAINGNDFSSIICDIIDEIDDELETQLENTQDLDTNSQCELQCNHSSTDA